MSNSYSKTRILVECALMIAVGTVLSTMAPSGACSPVS